MSTDVKYSNIFHAGRNMQNIPHDLGFRTFHAPDCGLQSCCRDSTHFHCRTCGYGTSQVGNLVAHRRMCVVNPETQPKEMGRLTPVSESSSSHDGALQSSSSSYAYYSPVPAAGPTQTNTQGSKIITTQQSAMFNFVLPSQSTQYSGLYGTQTVFPNPSLFSPSGFNGFGQLDASWLSQPRLMPPAVHSANPQPDILGNRFEKIEASSSPNCCGRIGPMENAALGLCSPLTAEAYKVVAKEFQTKIDSQNWYCSSQSMMGFGVQNPQQLSCKYAEPPSCSISLLLLEQNDMKQNDECINVDDLCFETPKTEPKMEEKEVEYNSCMQTSKKHFLEENGQDEVKNMEVRYQSTLEINDVNIDLESMTSDESDIIVEESESEVTDCSEISVSEAKRISSTRCLVCDRTATLHSFSNFMPLSEEAPVTTTSQVSVTTKLSQVVEDGLKQLEHCFICQRCLNLVNVIDNLEVRMKSMKKELTEMYKVSKEKRDPNVQEQEEPVKELQSLEPAPNAKPHCHICNKELCSAHYLKKHKQCHTKSFDYYCEYCGKGFAVLQKLETHVLMHSKTSRFQCELCGKRYIQKHSFTDHIRKHKGEFRYRCTTCDKGFVSKRVFKIHLQIHSPDSLICQFCGKQFNALANLSVHVKICSGDLKFSCSKCEKSFPIKSMLEKHIQFKHESKFDFVCNICEKGFPKESEYKAHLRCHSDNKPFKCTRCSKRYKSMSSLNQHSKVHSETLDLKCEVCRKEFTRKDALEDHLNQHAGRKPYKCDVCWKSFGDRNNFSRHMKRHNGTLKQVPCPVCGKLFTKGLKDHIVTHSGQKPFCCKLCGALFTVKSSLTKHFKTKHSVFEIKPNAI